MKLAKAITALVLEQMGCPIQSLTVVFDENSKENWVVGGEACAEGMP